MFDNPFIWIVLIWWLLTSFLGAGKKRRARLRAVVAEQPPEIADQEEVEPPRVVASPGTVPPVSAPVSIPEPDTPVPEPRRPKKPTLQDLFKQLGLEPRIDAGPEPETEPEPAQVEVIPEPVAEPPPVVERLPDAVFHTASAYDLPTIPSAASLPTGLTRRHWTPLQQMVIFKEVLDRPKGFRRGWEPR